MKKKSVYNQNVGDQECDDMEGNVKCQIVSLDFKIKVSKVFCLFLYSEINDIRITHFSFMFSLKIFT
jgi:hypothetical protein